MMNNDMHSEACDLFSKLEADKNFQMVCMDGSTNVVGIIKAAWAARAGNIPKIKSYLERVTSMNPRDGEIINAQNAEIEELRAALATSAAPERSGKLADDEPLLKWALRELLGALPKNRDWFNPDAEKVLLAFVAQKVTTPADSSSAAPSELSKRLRTHANAYTVGGRTEDLLHEAADELDRLAAPSPTGESLSDLPPVQILLDAAAECSCPEQMSDFVNLIGGDDDYAKRLLHCLRKRLAAPRQTEKFDLTDYSKPVVITNSTAGVEIPVPRQTEDGGLSAAIKGEVPLVEPVFIGKALRAGREAHVVLDGGAGPRAAVHLVNIALQGWYHTKETAEAYTKGYNDGVKHLRASLLEVATFAPKEPSVQGGVQKGGAA